jgi:hypothetical protein
VFSHDRVNAIWNLKRLESRSGFFFVFSNLWSRLVGDLPQEDVAKYGKQKEGSRKSWDSPL